MSEEPETQLERLQLREKSLLADADNAKQQIPALQNSLSSETEKRKSAEQQADEAATGLSSAKIRLSDLRAKVADLKAEISRQDAEEKRLNDSIARMKEATPFVATVKTEPGKKSWFHFAFALEPVQSSDAAPPDMSYPEPEVAFPDFPETDKLTSVDETTIEWAFASNRKGEAVVVPQETLENLGAPVFLVGDLHGDEASLRAILRKVFTAGQKGVLVFLGDLFDRGARAMETIRLFLWAAKTHPGQVLWLRGNHDEALDFEETPGKFVSGVSPHEFADWLGEHPECKDECRALCKIVRALPSVAVLGSVWASHGGVLHEDTCKDFRGFAELTPEMKIDFVWSRMKDTPSKMPNRSHKGAEVGYKQAVEFAKKLKELEGIDIRHIVCAHQHEHKDGFGYLPFTKCFRKGDLTCQCVCSFHDDEWDSLPVILRWRPDGMPVPIRFPQQTQPVAKE